MVYGSVCVGETGVGGSVSVELCMGEGGYVVRKTWMRVDAGAMESLDGR